MDVARDDQELLVVTENGFGKRTSIDEYRKTTRGTKGVETIKLTEKRKGALAGALVVREHQELVFISQERDGPAHRRARDQPLRAASAQGVTVMNMRDDDLVSAVALVVESDALDAAAVVESDAAARRRPDRRSPRTADDGPTPRRRRAGGGARATKIRDPSARVAIFGSPEKGGGPYQLVTVLAGPWRWPAARSVGLDPSSGIHTGPPS